MEPRPPRPSTSQPSSQALTASPSALSTTQIAQVDVPKPTKRAIAPFDVDQATVFLKVAKTHRLEALFSVALACGLRLGEATGLRWMDVDLAAGVIMVRVQLQSVKKPGEKRAVLVLQELKTEKSRRTLEIPKVCVDALRAHRTRQLEERLRAGVAWVDTGLVFTSFRKQSRGKVGAPLHPRNVLRTLHQLLDAAKLTRARFHDLRHSAASMLIAEGVELVEVSKLLGHSQLSITADLYAPLQKQTSVKARASWMGCSGISRVSEGVSNRCD
jgi:integrase